MKKWITFDLDGTLMQNPFVGHVFPEIEKRILQENKLLKDVVQQLILEHEARLNAGRTADAYDWDGIVSNYLRTNNLNSVINVEEILSGYCIQPNIYLLEDSISEVLDELKQRGYSLAVVTNGFTKYQLPVMDVLNLTNHFDLIVTPEEVGYAKPDKRVYSSILKLGEICGHVGDRIDHDIISANAVGIRSIWINRHLPDAIKNMIPSKRKSVEDIHTLVLQKLEMETKRRFEQLPTEAIPQEVISSIAELPIILT